MAFFGGLRNHCGSVGYGGFIFLRVLEDNKGLVGSLKNEG